MAAHVSPARMAACRVLLAMARSRSAHCDELLHTPAMDALAPGDRNLATALAMGVLRWQLALDAVIAPHVHRKSALDDAVAIALRLGVFQLLKMDRIPAHAALSESVELTKASGHSSASGLVNAVLRRVAESAASAQLDAMAAHPAWMLERWRRLYGDQTTQRIADYDQQQPAVVVRDDACTGELPAASLLAHARTVPEGEPIPAGARVQEEGSQLVAELAGHGLSILDCCAAPGGKTAILAENNPDAEITACDISEARLQAMRRSFARRPQTAHITSILADATALPFRRHFDLVMCDAPCSGTGTLARNPEIKLRLEPADLERQQQRQVAILRSAFGALAPGGRLVYSTCSLEPEENEAVVAALLAAEPQASVLQVDERLAAMKAEGGLLIAGHRLLRDIALRGPYLQTLPGSLPCDGFFVAILTRNS